MSSIVDNTPVVLDQTQDLDGRELHRLTLEHALPPFCKKASSSDVVGQQGGIFAYPPRQLYPCHTAAATYISTMFFMDKAGSFAPNIASYISDELAKYARYHGISERCEMLKAAFARKKLPAEESLSDDDFAVVLIPGQERLYPLRNSLEVKAAAEFLKLNTRLIPLEYRQKMATRILEKADEFGAGLSPLDAFLHKQAGIGYCTSQDAAAMLFERAILLQKAERIDEAIAMGSMAKKALAAGEAIHDTHNRVKLAAIVDNIDRETGLYKFYDGLVPPEDVLFGLTEKMANDLRNEHVSTITGNFYKRADLAGLRLEDIRDFMGEDFADAVSSGGLFVDADKMASVIPTLPLGDSKMFDRMVGALGVQPAATEPARVREGFTTNDLVELAA